MLKNTIWRIALVPSVYGVAVWGVLLLALSLQMIEVKVSFEAYVIYCYTVVCFIFSALVNYQFTRGIVARRVSERIRSDAVDGIALCFFLVLGVYGLLRYILDFSRLLEGENFFLIFIVDPLRLRVLATEGSSIGFQLSYLTWPVISYFIFWLKEAGCSRPKRIIVIAGLVFLFLANTLFVDRTRPVLLLITGALTYLVIFNGGIRKPLRVVMFAILGPIAIFFLQALFTSKYDADEGLFRNFAVYLLGGFGYFSAALSEQAPLGGLENTLLPAFKVLASLGLTAPPPSEILDFKGVPFLTNVGTFLYPLLADGGWGFVLLMLPVLVFGLDFMALRAFKSNTIFGVFVWANLVAASLLSFFVPKYNSTYLWLFLGLYLAIIASKALIRLGSGASCSGSRKVLAASYNDR